MKDWDVLGPSVVLMVSHPLTMAATGYPPSVSSLGMSKEASYEMLTKFSRKSSAPASSPGDVETRPPVGVGEGGGTEVGVGEGAGAEVAAGAGRGVLDPATAPGTGAGVATLDTVLCSEPCLGAGVTLAPGGGNVRRIGVSSACEEPDWLGAQANEPAIKISKMGMSVYFLKGLCLSTLVARWKCSIGWDEIEGMASTLRFDASESVRRSG